MHDGSMSERIRFIDALRGISLAGIVMAHFGEQYLGFLPPPGRPYNIHGMADGVLEALSWIFVCYLQAQAAWSWGNPGFQRTSRHCSNT